MYSLVSGLYQWLFAQQEIRLLLVGLEGSGKTTFFEQLKERHCKRRIAADTAATPPTTNAAAAPAEKGAAAAETCVVAPAAASAAQSASISSPLRTGATFLSAVTSAISTTEEDNAKISTLPTAASLEGNAGSRSRRRSGKGPLPTTAGGVVSAAAPRTANPKSCLPRVHSTTGLNFCQFSYEGVQVTLWDLPGHTSFHSIWSEYFKDAHCVLFFIDSSAEVASLANAAQALCALVCPLQPPCPEPRVAAAVQVEPHPQVPVLLIAAKQDTEHARSPAEVAVAVQHTLMESAAFQTQQQLQCPQQTQAQQERVSHESHTSHQRMQQHWNFDDSFLWRQQQRVGHLFPSVAPHTAMSAESVETLLRRAVDVAKTYVNLKNDCKEIAGTIGSRAPEKITEPEDAGAADNCNGHALPLYHKRERWRNSILGRKAFVRRKVVPAYFATREELYRLACYSEHDMKQKENLSCHCSFDSSFNGRALPVSASEGIYYCTTRCREIVGAAENKSMTFNCSHGAPSREKDDSSSRQSSPSAGETPSRERSGLYEL